MLIRLLRSPWRGRRATLAPSTPIAALASSLLGLALVACGDGPAPPAPFDDPEPDAEAGVDPDDDAGGGTVREDDAGVAVDPGRNEFGICPALSPDQVYVQIATKAGMFYASSMSYAGSAFGFGEGSLPCFGLHCAAIITQDGRYIGRRCDEASAFGFSLWENNPDRVTWSAQRKRWSVPAASENDTELLVEDQCSSGTRPRYLAFAYPDRDGALVACGGTGAENWYDTEDTSTPLPPPYLSMQGKGVDQLLALGRNERMLWRTDDGQLVIGVGGKAVASATSVGYAWLARASEEGFFIVTQSATNPKDLRLFFMSQTSALSQRATYLNPDGVALNAALDYALSPDGSLFVVRFMSGAPTTVVRFDPDGSAPRVLLELTTDAASADDPLRPNIIHGLVTGG